MPLLDSNSILAYAGYSAVKSCAAATMRGETAEASAKANKAEMEAEQSRIMLESMKKDVEIEDLDRKLRLAELEARVRSDKLDELDRIKAAKDKGHSKALLVASGYDETYLDEIWDEL